MEELLAAGGLLNKLDKKTRQKARRTEIWWDQTFISGTLAAKSLCNIYQG